MQKNHILQGDCIAMTDRLDEESIDLTVFSPLTIQLGTIKKAGYLIIKCLASLCIE